jgi:hypothetical protein
VRKAVAEPDASADGEHGGAYEGVAKKKRSRLPRRPAKGLLNEEIRNYSQSEGPRPR